MQVAFASYTDFQKISGLGRSTIYDLLSRGELKAVRVGKRVLIDVEHGIAWLRAQPPAELNTRRPIKAKQA